MARTHRMRLEVAIFYVLVDIAKKLDAIDGRLHMLNGGY